MTATLQTARSPGAAASGAPGAFVSPRSDGWLVGGVAVAGWVVMAGSGRLGFDVPAFGGVVLWVLLAAIATHFGISYHLAYGEGWSAVRRHPWALAAAPLALLAGAIAIAWGVIADHRLLADSGPQIGLVAVYSLTTWHYVKQTYGVAMMSLRMHGIAVDRPIAAVLRYGIYPLWFLDAATVWSRGYRANDYGFDASYQVLPHWSVDAFRLASIGAGLLLVGALAAIRIRSGRLPSAVWTPYAAAMLWILWSPDHISAIVVLGAAHAVQYLACAHRAEVEWGATIGDDRPVVRWASLFGGALACGMLLTYWLPMWLGYAGGTQLGITLAALVFVVLNLHHYAIDAVIWRRSDPHVGRVVGSGTRSNPSTS